MSDFLAVVIGVLLGVLASVPVAMVIAASTRQPWDICDLSGWIPPDEISEETAVTLFFDGSSLDVI